jgi:SpoVK/Ycf46/Vps4 family AAA+-type ATPase
MYAPWARSLRTAARWHRPDPLAASNRGSPVLRARFASLPASGAADDSNSNEGREKPKRDEHKDGQGKAAPTEPVPRSDENIFGEPGFNGTAESQSRLKKRGNGSLQSRSSRNRTKEMPPLQLPEDFRATNIYQYGDERKPIARSSVDIQRSRSSGKKPDSGANASVSTSEENQTFKSAKLLDGDAAALLDLVLWSDDAVRHERLHTLEGALDPQGLAHIARRGELILGVAYLLAGRMALKLASHGSDVSDTDAAAASQARTALFENSGTFMSSDAMLSLFDFYEAEDVGALDDSDRALSGTFAFWSRVYLKGLVRFVLHATSPYAPELGERHNDAVDEVLHLVRSDLLSKAPRSIKASEIKRPVTVLNFPYYKGFSWPKDVVRDIAAELRADVLFLTPSHLARILGRHLGQDPVHAPGSISLLGYKTSRYQGAIVEDSSNDDDHDADAYLVIGQDRKFKDAKKGLSIMEQLMGEANNRGKTDDLWEDLKVNAALEEIIHAATRTTGSSTQPLIIHIHDFNALNADPDGNSLLNKLRKIVDTMWADGRQITLVGTCSSLETTKTYNSDLKGLEASEHLVTFQTCRQRLWHWVELGDSMAKDRVIENAANIHFILQCLLGPDYQQSLEDFTQNASLALTFLETTDRLEESLIDMHGGQRLAKVILGELRGDACQNGVKWHDIITAASTIHRNDKPLKQAKSAPKDSTNGFGFVPDGKEKKPKKEPAESQTRERARHPSEDYEAKMLTGLVDADSIETTFEHVHAPKDTIDSIKLLTQLALLHPEAFSHGVLASNRIPGCLLYGPPGTGKTLLAKAVAKESGANMIEISGASINDKYVGESEKRIQALFRLAKKKQPLVIFIDEADSLLADRGIRGHHTGRRETINQFLREWDGMDTTKAFIMVATNRPFDLDEAVLRRLPRRLLIDLPLESDRVTILKIHLKGETLADDISVEKLAKDTPMYSGSDLKNVCVAAAMAAVKETMDAKKAWEGPGEFQWPAQRVLQLRHFQKAMKEVSASVSEDMSSFANIRKFDEKYGEGSSRRKKKAGMGFGVETPGNVVDQARVRPEARP